MDVLAKPYFIAVLAVCMTPGFVFAQSCPHGYMPLGGQQAGWTGCAPISAPDQPPPDPGPQWSTRWGAVAVDAGAGRFGGVDGAVSKRSAYKAAVAACKDNGGRKCKVLLGYYNQCGAIAWGNNRLESFSAAQQQEAMDGAMDYCRAKTENCQIYYAGCSYPQLVR